MKTYIFTSVATIEAESEQEAKEMLFDNSVDFVAKVEAEEIPEPSEDTIFKCGECDYEQEWTMTQVQEQGTPICPECDVDMTLIINN